MNTTVVGIDIGKSTCHICVIAPDGTQASRTAQREHVAALLLPTIPADPPAIIALELTGSLALPVLTGLEESPHSIMIAQHTDSAALRQLLRQRKKTDKLDAKLIARLAAMLTSPETAPLVSAHLIPWQTIRVAILGRSQARHLQALIKDRVRVILKRQYATSAQAVAHYTRQIEFLTQLIAEAETLLIETASPAARLLATIPGVSLRRACILDAAIGEISRFPSCNHLVNYLGLVPPHRPQSGISTGRPVRRKGLDLLHTELHMGALTIARYPVKHGVLGETYLRVKARTGSGKAGMWAVKRKLARIAWGVLTSGQPHQQKGVL